MPSHQPHELRSMPLASVLPNRYLSVCRFFLYSCPGVLRRHAGGLGGTKRLEASIHVLPPNEPPSRKPLRIGGHIHRTYFIPRAAPQTPRVSRKSPQKMWVNVSPNPPSFSRLDTSINNYRLQSLLVLLPPFPLHSQRPSP